MSKHYVYLIKTKGDTVCGNGFGFRMIHPRECDCLFVNSQDRLRCVDVILEERPGNAALQLVQPPNICILRKEFWDLFSDVAEPYMNVGKVFSKDSILSESFVSVTGKKRLKIRGKKAASRTCQACGRISYYPFYPYMIYEKEYFEQPIYESLTVSGIVINQELKERIDPKIFKGFHVIKIPVIQQIKDELESLPDVLAEMVFATTNL